MVEKDLEEIEEELLQNVDSLYAEYGSDVTRSDIEEMIKDYCYTE